MYVGFKYDLLLDTGSESNLIREAIAHNINAIIRPSSTQVPTQADGRSTMNQVGETTLVCNLGNRKLQLDALVIRNLSSPIIAGVPFLDQHDVMINTRTCRITIDDYKYNHDSQWASNKGVNLTTTTFVRAPSSITVWPGEDLHCPVTVSECPDTFLQPRVAMASSGW